MYCVVFELILGNGIPYFPIFLLSGILVWNLFATALVAGVRIRGQQRRGW